MSTAFGNLVGGEWNWAVSEGGFVAGYQNETMGLNASVVGGRNNVTQSDYSLILGGQNNTTTAILQVAQ